MKCSSCQFDNPEGMNFCGKCGSPLNAPCMQCGYKNPVGLEFCKRCEGKIVRKVAVPAYARRSPMEYTPPFLAEKVLKVGGALVGERKLVSVLFADVANFTGIAEGLDPEEVHEIMDGCFELLGREVHAAGGTINQYTGDGIMALFGAPITYNDHIRPACHAALQIQKRLKGYYEKIVDHYSVSLKLRIGINTGPVIVGAIGDNLRLDYTAVGDTTNLAARLQSLATPGEILVSERMKQGAEGYFLFQDVGRLTIKGKKNPVQAFTLVKELPSGNRVQRLSQNRIPFLDREKEADLLKKEFKASLSHGPRIVAVTGEVGIGKTRLLSHFCRNIEDNRVHLFEGNCRPYTNSAALYPLKHMFRSYFELSEDDSHEQMRSKIRRRLSAALPPSSLDHFLELFSEVRKWRKTSPMIVEGKKRTLFRAIHDLLISIASLGPIIMIINDMQWIDSSSREFLAFLFRTSEKTPILLICLGRSEESFHSLDTPTHFIRLEPLSEKQATDLFSAVLETKYFDPEISKEIVSNAGGNPLFIVEMAEALKQQGLIVGDDLRRTIRVPLKELKTPDSIQGVLAARLDALAPDQKHLAQLAAVIGREFSLDLLQPLIELEEDLSESLEALEQAGIIEKRPADDGGCYQFRQPAIQEVAYNSLLFKERSRYHQMVGETIETLYHRNLDFKIGLLAHHFFRAKNWPKALEYTLEAAEQSSHAYACHEVISNIDQALEILSEGQWENVAIKKLGILERKGKMHFCLGQTKAAYQVFKSILSEARRLGNREVESEALFRQGWIYFYMHKPRSAETLLIEAIQLSTQEGFAGILLKAKGFLGFVYAVLGNLKQAKPLLIEAFHLSEKQDALEDKAWSLTNLIRYYNWVGEFERALKYSRQLDTLNREVRSPYFKILLHFSQGCIYGALGQIGEAKKSLETGLKHLESGNDSFWQPRFLNTMGWIHAENGEIEDAVKLNRQSLELAVKTSDPEIIHNAKINLGENYLAMGDLQEAQNILVKTWQEVRKPGISYTRWRYKTRLLIALGELYGRSGDNKRGLYFIRKALNLAQKNGAKKHHARALIIKAQLLSLSRPGVARRSFSEALALSEEMGTILLTKRIRQSMSELEK
jgi:class 3 adenylate cyclase/tetratricopeptide (TPR) repeat protein